jgi:hypothetical protein
LIGHGKPAFGKPAGLSKAACALRRGFGRNERAAAVVRIHSGGDGA